MSKKITFLILSLFFVATIVSIIKLPSVAPLFGLLVLFLSLAITIYSIFEKNKYIENPRPKIAKDISIFVITLLLIIFLGGLAGMFANYYASLRFGAVVGFVTAMAASFAVGYFVKKGVGKLGK